MSLITAFQPKGAFGLFHDFRAGWNTKSVISAVLQTFIFKGNWNSLLSNIYSASTLEQIQNIRIAGGWVGGSMGGRDKAS